MSAQTVHTLGEFVLVGYAGAAIGWIGRGVFEYRRRRLPVRVRPDRLGR